VFSECSRRIGLPQIPHEGIGKVKMEFGLLCLAQNMAKLAVKSLPVFYFAFFFLSLWNEKGLTGLTF
jgi:hypothetical protein